ncbi:hypothetical protein B0H63DRAFT_29461 [Podospora didyma]|uniref:Uncharacterized protein n=1 Tax=Podospora didyma TaxID=330526 RepID=A0AAE0P5S6_9PEZI|nr:hypothetical protein B0H63DRAFT_29461 [Podospora didyma]
MLRRGALPRSCCPKWVVDGDDGLSTNCRQLGELGRVFGDLTRLFFFWSCRGSSRVWQLTAAGCLLAPQRDNAPDKASRRQAERTRDGAKFGSRGFPCNYALSRFGHRRRAEARTSWERGRELMDLTHRRTGICRDEMDGRSCRATSGTAAQRSPLALSSGLPGLPLGYGLFNTCALGTVGILRREWTTHFSATGRGKWAVLLTRSVARLQSRTFFWLR